MKIWSHSAFNRKIWTIFRWWIESTTCKWCFLLNNDIKKKKKSLNKVWILNYLAFPLLNCLYPETLNIIRLQLLTVLRLQWLLFIKNCNKVDRWNVIAAYISSMMRLIQSCMAGLGKTFNLGHIHQDLPELGECGTARIGQGWNLVAIGHWAQSWNKHRERSQGGLVKKRQTILVNVYFFVSPPMQWPTRICPSSPNGNAAHSNVSSKSACLW